MQHSCFRQTESVTAEAKNVQAQPAAPQRVVDFDMLGEAEKAVYRLMVADVPVLPDEICRDGSLPMQNVLSALTMLEIAGAVEAGAGGYYIRPSGDTFDLDSE